MNTQEQNLKRQWESLGISNDFIFCKVMATEKELLRELVHRILPNIQFSDMTVIAQKTEKDGLDTHGVRFDIFIKDDTGRVIEIEMQVLNTGNLPLRIRFYSSMVDTQMLGPGESYSKLKEKYIIVICPFDPFGQDRHFYSFTSRCDQDYQLQMGDKSQYIVLNANGTLNDVSDELEVFLDYVAGKTSNDDYIQKLEGAVKKVKANKEWRRDYMYMEMKLLEREEEGEKKGREEGREAKEREMIETMLGKGKTPEEIAELCDISLDRVKEVEEAMKNKAA